MFISKKVSKSIEGWFDILLQYDLEVINLAGIMNHLPDAVSRFYDNDDRDPALSREVLIGSTDHTNEQEVILKPPSSRKSHESLLAMENVTMLEDFADLEVISD
jgi:hypothetical protein